MSRSPTGANTQKHATTISFPLVSSKCDWVFEAVMMSDETIRSAPEISSLSMRRGVSEDAEIQQSSKERKRRCVCGDNWRTEKLAALITFQTGER